MVENAPASRVNNAPNGAMKTRRLVGSKMLTLTAGEVAVTVPPKACQPKSGWFTMNVPIPMDKPLKLGP